MPVQHTLKDIVHVASNTTALVKQGAKEAAEHISGHTGAHMVGEGAGKLISEGSKTAVHNASLVSQNTSGFFTGIEGGLGTIIGAGLAAGVNAAFVHAEYNNARREIIATYADELSAKLGKPKHKLKHKDIRCLAEGDASQGVEKNQVIDEAITKARRTRNLGVGLALVATVASFALLLPILPHVALTASNIPLLIGHGLIGLLSYNAIRTPLRWAGEKIMGLDKKTAHERILDLERDRAMGRQITREQVFSVFVSANKQLDGLIEQAFGKPYEDLPLIQAQKIAANLGSMVSLERVTDAINHGKVDITELAFLVDGQESGHSPEQAPLPKIGWLGSIKEKLFGTKKDTPQAQAAMPEYDNPTPSKSFVERLNQSRAAETSLLQQR